MWFKNRTKLFRKRALHRAKIFFSYWLKPRTGKEPVFVIAARRTGSNMLISCLNSVPQASFAGEILNKSMSCGLRQRFISKKSVLRHIVHSVQHCEQALCGAKFVQTHLDTHGIGPSDLKRLFPNARFIILYRRSLLEQFVSLKIAEMTDVWQWTREFKLPECLSISVPEFTEFCAETKKFYERLFQEDCLKDCSLVLGYEEFAEDPQGVFEESVFPFLRRPAVPVRNGMIKQNTQELRQIVANYLEVEPFLHHPSARQEYSSARHALQGATHVA